MLHTSVGQNHKIANISVAYELCDSRIDMKLSKAKNRLHKATTEALESKIDILEMDLKEWLQISALISALILVYDFKFNNF